MEDKELENIIDNIRNNIKSVAKTDMQLLAHIIQDMHKRLVSLENRGATTLYQVLNLIFQFYIGSGILALAIAVYLLSKKN